MMAARRWRAPNLMFRELMQFNKRFAGIVNFFLNEVVSPFLRDSRWFFYIPMKLLLGSKADTYLNFREHSPFMTESEYRQAYIDTAGVELVKDSDLNKECLERIPKEVSGRSVLEVGCGRGLLMGLLAENPAYKIIATDIFLTKEMKEQNSGLFVQSSVERLPFGDKQFDTTICTHVLEHVLDLHSSIEELRRVTSKRLIVVLPKERPYRFGFNLHLTFFPYRATVFSLLGRQTSTRRQSCELEGRDWFYVEDLYD